MEKTFYIYGLVDPRDSCLFYVGKGRGSRCKVHFRPSKLADGSPKSERILAIRSDGAEAQVVLLATDLEECESLELEKLWIAHFGRNNLCNRTAGGQGVSGLQSFLGRKHKEETKELLRQSKLGDKNPMFGRSRSPESLAKFKAATSGDKHHMFGKSHSQETRDKISQSLKGRQLSEHQCRQRSESMKRVWAQRKAVDRGHS